MLVVWDDPDGVEVSDHGFAEAGHEQPFLV